MKAFRYIVTRRCLRDESLYPTRRLEEEFAGHQELKFYDEAGHEYALQADSEGCLRGAGQLYRDHNLGVNDVLLITPLMAGAYRIDSVVKPYERPKASWEETAKHRSNSAAAQPIQRPSDTAPSPAPLQTTRVTAHVREVRGGGAPEKTQPSAQVGASEGVSVKPVSVKPVSVKSVSVRPMVRVASNSAQSEPNTGVAGMGVHIQEMRQGGVQARGTANTSGVQIRVIRSSESAGHEPKTSGVLFGRAAGKTRTSGGGQRSDGGANDGKAKKRVGVRAIRNSHQTSDGQGSEPQRTGTFKSAKPAATASERLQRDLRQREARAEHGSQAITTAETTAESVPSHFQPHSQQPRRSPQVQPTPTDMALQELGRLTGYRVDYLGGGLTRLRADLGKHSHHVLIADSASAANAHEWRSRGEAIPTYKLWLVDEGQAVAEAPILTREAVHMLLGQARLAPLSALDLRPYWHARRMDVRSAENLASLAKQYLAQRGAFAGVLTALAQQPANSIVSRSRLAELPLNLSSVDLDRALNILSQPPFQLLTPLDKDEFLLRQSVPAFLSGFGEYVQGVSRRLVAADQLGLEVALADAE